MQSLTGSGQGFDASKYYRMKIVPGVYRIFSCGIAAAAILMPAHETCAQVNDTHFIRSFLDSPPDALTTTDTVSFIFIGDVMLHKAQLDNAHSRYVSMFGSEPPDSHHAYDFSPYLEDIRGMVSEADIAVANMEFTLAGPPFTGYPSFSAPDSYAEYMADCGIDIFLTANNHIFDKGKAGIERTMEVCRKLETERHIMVTGCREDGNSWPRKFLLKRVGSLTTAFLNFTYGTNAPVSGDYSVNMLRKEDVRQALDEARQAGADLIVVLPHWGDEYKTRHSAAQEEMAEWIAMHGADIIIGTHPHVIQDCDTIRVGTESGVKDVPVVYSLGNIVSNMSAPGTQAGLLLKMTAVKHLGGGTEILPLEFRYTWCSLPGRLTDSHKTIFIRDGLHRRKEWLNPRDHTKMTDTYYRIKRETGISDEKDNKTGSD